VIIVSLLIIALAVVAVLYRAEVRLTLLLAGLTLGALAGRPMEIVRKFLETFTSEQFLLPIGCCMGFAYVLKHTECDRHLIHLLMRPLRRARALLVPGVVLVGVLVNVPLLSQGSTAVAVGSVLVPVLRAAGLSATTSGAALAMGASVGGELLNPGAPEFRTICAKREEAGEQVPAVAIVRRVFPLLLIHLAVSLPLFWVRCAWAEGRRELPPEEPDEGFRLNVFKALVPVVPLVLLFLTALPPPLRAITVPADWLVAPGTPQSLFDARLVGVAMLVGTVVAALSSPAKAGATAAVFFEGAGYALTTITSVIVAANCFGKGVELAGIDKLLKELIAALPHLLLPLAAVIPALFAWVCGSGMASTQSLYGFFDGPAVEHGADPVHVGALVSLAAATGRTLSPVAAVVLLSSTMTGSTPLAIVRRLWLPLLAGLAAVVAGAAVLG
jgi:DcuC family C4-dicarboxylate transporter